MQLLKHTDKKTNKIENVGIVILTSSDLKSGFNFGYKDMEESMGPGYYDCPMSILKLLSPTDNEFALEWRKKCMDKSKHKSWLKDVKIGESIIYTDYSGNEYTLVKHEPAYQFKTWFWYCPANGHYIKKTRINENNARLNIPA